MDDPDSTLKFEHPKWKSNLVENLTVLFQKGELCDLHIMCRDHRDINISLACHACILASASPVVRNLLVKNDIFAAWTKLAIKSSGISAREWEYILKYVYTGSVNIQEPHIYAVWKAALYLQIDILVTVLATCIHKYHYAGTERDKIPHLKVCPFDPTCAKTHESSPMSDIKTTPQYKHLKFLDDMSPRKRDSGQRQSISFQSDKFNTSFQQYDQNFKINDASTISKNQNNHKTVYEISDSEESADLQKIDQINVNQNLTSQTMYNKCDNNTEPSATKKRKMYTPRRVHSNVKHSQEVASNTCPVYSEESSTTSNQKETDKQKDDLLLSYYRCIQDSFDFHLNPSNKTFSPENVENSNDNISTHKPLVIAPITNECVIDENHLKDSTPTGYFRTNIKEENHTDEEPCHKTTSYKNSDSAQKSVLYDLLHTRTTSPAPETSSVLKSLLVSSCNNYRSPEKPHHTKKPQESIQFKESSDEEDQDLINYLIDSHTVNDKKSDPDYKPSVKCKRKLKSEYRIVNRTTEKPASTISMKSNTVSGSSNPIIRREPYSASSILLSMIKDAGAKKSSNEVTTSSAPVLNSVQPINLAKGESTAADQSNEGSPSSSAKGILRNLLKERGHCEDKPCDTNHKVAAGSVTSDNTVKTPSQSPPPNTLPFSNVLQNMALAYNSATRVSETSLLKNILQDPEKQKGKNLATDNLSSSHGPHDLSVSTEDKPRVIKDSCEQPSQLKSLLTIPSDKAVTETNKLQITENSKDINTAISDIISGSLLNIVNSPSEKTDSDQNIKSVESGNDTNQCLKLTLCKTGCEFKVKEEISSLNLCSHYSSIGENRSKAEIPTIDNTLLCNKGLNSGNTYEKIESHNKDAENGACGEPSTDNLFLKTLNRPENKLETYLPESSKNSTEPNVEKKNENSDESECSDVEVAHFAGLQSADSAASISDTEVAEDF